MLAVSCQWPLDRGGGEGKCLFIDTSGASLLPKFVRLQSHPASP
jgi:hypothetical protein